MENLEDKSTNELKSEFEKIFKAHADLKDRMLKAYDLLESMGERGRKIYKIIEKRTKGINE